jgi:hypothetical protein
MAGENDRLKPVRTLSLYVAESGSELQRLSGGFCLLSEQRGTRLALLECFGDYFRVSSPVTSLYHPG